MRIKCIKDDYVRLEKFQFYNQLYGKDFTPTIQVDKYYLVTDIDNIGYKIIDDLGRNYWYCKELFESLEEKRDNLINEILNEH